MNDVGETRPASPDERAADETRPPYPFRSFLGATVLGLLALLATAGVKSYRDLGAARDHERALLGQIADTKERLRVLTERIERIEDDPAMLERLAREELGMVREGDVVIVLPEEEPDDTGARSTSGSQGPIGPSD